MSKKNNSKVSKKNYVGLKRVVVEGKRVWEYQGGFFDSLKELDMSKNPSKYMSIRFTPKTKFEPVSNDVTTTNDFIEIEKNKEIK